MPKETIRSDARYGDESPTFAQVGWSADGSVQVSVMRSGDYDEPRSPRPGFHASLDRGGINQMIRALRKARDRAYGADA